MRLIHLLTACTLIALLLPAPGHAQWIEPPGRGWVQVSIYHHDTRKRFTSTRSVESLFNEGGRSITTSFFLTGVAGIVRGADVWVQVPYNRLEFNDVVDERMSVGIGDPRFHLRIGPALFGLRPWPVALRGGVKFSLGKFTRDAEIIPLSEGQRDWELMLELGHSFYPRSLYVMGWIGYRWREFNDEIDRKPGNERFAFVAVGGSLRSFEWKLAAEGLSGLSPLRRLPPDVEIKLVQDKRELVQIMPSIGRRVGPGFLEIGGRFPVAGRNLPAGPAVFVGYFFRWGWK
ncbi:MAG: hypothetical protein ACE5G0_22280 [Rhodothermales bacterium]